MMGEYRDLQAMSDAATQLRKAKAAANREKLEAPFALALRAYELAPFEREYRFLEGRKWAFDFAWPERMVAFEIEGGLWRGRHTSPEGFTDDCVKYNTATRLGWRVFRVTGEMVLNGQAVLLARRVLNGWLDDDI